MAAVTCDVVVLGVGTAGEDAALRLTKAGLDVVGIEPNLIGGECPFWGCLPSKSLIRSANQSAEARRADGRVGKVSIDPDWPLVAQRLRAEVTGGWDDSAGVERFESRGGRLMRGYGHVTAPRTVVVDDTEIQAGKGIVVATGSRPFIPPVPRLANGPYWTNHDAIETEELPSSLIILGGGAIGCELGQLFARFGVSVSIVEGEERLLAAEEPEASAVVTAAMAEDGVDVITGRRAASVSYGDGVTVTLDGGGQVDGERILVATGRRADADGIGLPNAGATTDRGFVRVDGRMRAADGMWAIGDVTGESLLTEVAMYQSLIAIEDVLGAEPEPASYEAIPRITFTDPELGAVGLTENQASEQGYDVEVVTKDVQAPFRGWLHRTGNTGVLKLVVDRASRRLLGGTAIGPHGGDVVGFLALAVQEGIPIDRLGRMVYGFPTFYGGVGEALGAYGRGILKVMDPETEPMFDDPVPV